MLHTCNYNKCLYGTHFIHSWYQPWVGIAQLVQGLGNGLDNLGFESWHVALSPGVKQPGCKADHWTPCNAKDKNGDVGTSHNPKTALLSVQTPAVDLTSACTPDQHLQPANDPYSASNADRHSMYCSTNATRFYSETYMQFKINVMI
jgi:hypothetical protein